MLRKVISYAARDRFNYVGASTVGLASRAIEGGRLVEAVAWIVGGATLSTLCVMLSE